jgi:hypothetical protein
MNKQEKMQVMDSRPCPFGCYPYPFDARIIGYPNEPTFLRKKVEMTNYILSIIEGRNEQRQ